jgi:aspartate 1-decarboxylase
MQVELMRAKIHRAVVTSADVEYEGSIGIDADLLAAAGIFPYEAVHIWNVTRGTRLVTYAIKAAAGSGEIKPNGGAALHNMTGDIIIIAAFGHIHTRDAYDFQPTIVLVDEKNAIKELKVGTMKMRLTCGTALSGE